MKIYAGVYKNLNGQIYDIAENPDKEDKFPWIDEDGDKYTNEGEMEGCDDNYKLVERISPEDGIFIKFEDMGIPEGWEFDKFDIPSDEYITQLDGEPYLVDKSENWKIREFIIKKVKKTEYWVLLNYTNTIIDSFSSKSLAEEGVNKYYNCRVVQMVVK